MPNHMKYNYDTIDKGAEKVQFKKEDSEQNKKLMKSLMNLKTGQQLLIIN